MYLVVSSISGFLNTWNEYMPCLNHIRAKAFDPEMVYLQPTIHTDLDICKKILIINGFYSKKI